MNNTKRNLLPALDAAANKIDGNKLAQVAELMDYWTREENECMMNDLERQEQAMLKMAGEIVRLTQRVSTLQMELTDVVDQRGALRTELDFRIEAEAEFRTVILLYSNEVNQLIPDRRYEHRVAYDQFGILHPVMVSRNLNEEQEDEEMEVIDLTGETDVESSDDEHFQDTLAMLRGDA